MSLDQIFLIIGIYLAVMVVIALLVWKKRVGLMALVLKVYGQGAILNTKVKGNRAYLPKSIFSKKKTYISFEPRDVFEVKIPHFSLKGKVKMILGVEGRHKAIRLENKSGNPKETFVDSSYFNTEKEWTDYINAQNARSQAKVKSMSNTQFIVLACLAMAGLFLLFMIANRMGVF